MPASSDLVILITGASRGLGREVARAFAHRGARLVLTARGEQALQDTVEELRQQTDVVALAGDVADSVHAQQLIDLARSRFGRVDVLINNASAIGPSPMPPLEVYPLDALTTVFAVNVLAPLRLAQLVLPEMKRRGSGVIVNVTSDAGVNAYAGWGGYGASKAALEHISRTLAAELEGTGVRVYVVDPGDMQTQMHQEAEPDVDLSALPTPDIPAPFLVRLVEQETTASGRFEAQAHLADAGR